MNGGFCRTVAPIWSASSWVLGIFLHQDLGLDVARGLDLDDARVVRRDRADLVVVDRIGRVSKVELLLDLFVLEPLFVEFVPQRVTLLGVARESLSVQRHRDLVNLGDRHRVENRPLFDDEGDGDGRGATKDSRELVLGADVRMVGPLGTRDGVDLYRGPGERHADRGQGRIENRVEEEPGRNDQQKSDDAATSHNQLREAKCQRFLRIRSRSFGHRFLSRVRDQHTGRLRRLNSPASGRIAKPAISGAAAPMLMTPVSGQAW